MLIWKPVKGFEDYWINTDGEIRNSAGTILTPSISKKGYKQIRLYNHNGDRPCKGIHRLVAETFIPNPNNLPQVNHIDGNKENNNVANLEWCNNSYNMLHMYKITSKKRGSVSKHIQEEIRVLYPNFTLKELSKKYGVSVTTVWRIIHKVY